MKRVELFRIETAEYDEFEGKSLKMLQNLLSTCKAVEIFKSCDGEIVIVGSGNEIEQGAKG